MMRKRWFLFAVLLTLAETCAGQRASNWRAYKAVDGMGEPICSGVTIGPHGKLWVRHPDTDSVSVLDGYSVQNMPAPNSDNSRIYESPGGQLWTASQEGLEEFKGGAWTTYPVSEVVAFFRTNRIHSPQSVPLHPIRLGRVIFLLPEGLMQFGAEDHKLPVTTLLRKASESRLERFLGMAGTRDGGLVISGVRGLAYLPGPTRVITPETKWREYVTPDSLQIKNLQQPVEDDEGGITAIAESLAGDQKLVVHFDGQNWSTYPAGNRDIRAAWRGQENSFWIMTPDSLSMLEEGQKEWVVNEDIAARRYFDFAVGTRGVFWLATSDGLFRYAPSAWRPLAGLRNLNSRIHSLTEDQAGRLWVTSENSLALIQNDQVRTYPFPKDLLGSSLSSMKLFALTNGTLVLDKGGRNLQFDPLTEKFHDISTADGSRLNPIGLLRDRTLGVQVFNPSRTGDVFHLEAFDGADFSSLPFVQPELNPGGELLLLASQNGNLWLSGKKGVVCYRDNKWQSFGPTDGTAPDKVTCVTEISEDRIWCGAQDKIWECDGKIWRVIRTGFDRVNSLLTGRDGSVWVASESGLFRFHHGAWVANSIEEGFPGGAVREVFEDHRGRIWADANRGLSLYHPEADQDPPKTSMDSLTGWKNTVTDGSAVTISFSGQDKWKFTPTDRLLYSYRLDGQEWSRYQEERTAQLSDLSAGKHYFQVQCMDRNWNIDPKPDLLEFVVVLPWYKESRLLSISSAGLAVAIFFAGLAFNRHRRLVRSYAEVEAKVTLRTQQLEVANQELLHSQKMNALGTLAAGIAHDFNNILSIIKGSAQIIEDNLENQDKIRTRTNRIKTVVEQGTGIVKAMLGFSRPSDKKLAMCDINAVVKETINLLGDRFLREVQVQFDPTPGLPAVPASKDFIQQILLNLVFNAGEAMNGRRQVMLSADKTSQLPAASVLAPAQASSYIFVSVQDFGSGIAPDIMPRIFEPFFTTKSLSARRGTGLGLSMVYELARQLECGLAVQSAVGSGSTFTLIIPVRDLPMDSPATWE
ncbi:MAG: Histidine kinase [Pedosphaera sp.]|nr:Histidine kinase [Pedosphaera sp.]